MDGFVRGRRRYTENNWELSYVRKLNYLGIQHLGLALAVAFIGHYEGGSDVSCSLNCLHPSENPIA